MNQIVSIDDLIRNDNDQIIRKRKNPTLFILLFIIGIISLFFAYSPALMDKMNLVTGLWVLGFSFIVAGAVGLIVPRKAFYYKPTGEQLIRKELYFNPKDKNRALEALIKGDSDLLPPQIPNSRAAIMVVMYCTSQNYCVLAQPMEYVPFQFVAVQPAIWNEQRA